MRVALFKSFEIVDGALIGLLLVTSDLLLDFSVGVGVTSNN
jgi:hypothetical protein